MTSSHVVQQEPDPEGRMRLPMRADNAALESIYERLREDGHRGSAAEFFGPVWERACGAVRGRVSDQRLDVSKYMDAEDINDFAEEEKDELAEMAEDEGLSESDQEMLDLHSEIISYYESGEEAEEAYADDYRHWLSVVFPEKVFLSSEDRREIDAAHQWLREFVGATEHTDGGAAESAERLLRWIVAVWVALYRVIDNAGSGVAESVLSGVSDTNLLRALDLTQDVNEPPIVPESAAYDPELLLSQGYSVYHFEG